MANKRNLLGFLNLNDGTTMLVLGLLGGIAASYYFESTIDPITNKVFGYVDPYIPGIQPSEMALSKGTPAPAVPSAVPGAVTGATIAAANYADEYYGDGGETEYGYSDYDEDSTYYPEEYY